MQTAEVIGRGGEHVAYGDGASFRELASTMSTTDIQMTQVSPADVLEHVYIADCTWVNGDALDFWEDACEVTSFGSACDLCDGAVGSWPHIQGPNVCRVDEETTAVILAEVSNKLQQDCC